MTLSINNANWFKTLQNINFHAEQGASIIDRTLQVNEELKNKIKEKEVLNLYQDYADGNNDILYPYMAGIQTFHYFKVLDKFGKMVFESKNASEGWDGTKNGTKLPMDVYLWMSEGVDYNGKLIQKTGNTLLIR